MDIFDILLSATPQLTPTTQALMIRKFGSAQRLFAASREELISKGGLNQLGVEAVMGQERIDEATQELIYCESNGIKPIASTDAEYPDLLRITHDPPHVIYTMGDASILNKNLISVVGARKITTYGEMSCAKIIEQLAERIKDLVIVSGLAYGVDAAAHRAAIDVGVPTIAVVANHLPKVTPAGNTNLARAIIDEGGAIVTEMRSTMRSFRSSFIPRNRIIAGLSSATLIIESGIKGGSKATAEMASREGRIVGALPGRILDEMSMGCNDLIVRKVAEPITSGDDLINLLDWGDRCRVTGEAAAVKAHSKREDLLSSLNENQRGLLGCFRSDEPLHISQLADLSLMGVGELVGLLIELELYGAVRALPGSRYMRLVKIDI